MSMKTMLDCWVHTHIGMHRNLVACPDQKLDCDHLMPNRNFPHGLLSLQNWFKHKTKGFRARLGDISKTP